MQFRKPILYYIYAGVVWFIFAALLGLMNQLQIISQWPGSDTGISYGVLRPIFTTSLIYGGMLSLFFAAAYYILHKTTEGMKFEVLALTQFTVQQFAVLGGLVTIAYGFNNGFEYGEMSWVSDKTLALSFTLFLILAIAALWKTERPAPAAILAVLGGIGGLVVVVVGNFSLPTGFFTSSRLTSGMGDASLQELFRSGVLGYFIIVPILTVLWFFIPSYMKTSLYSDSLARLLVVLLLIAIPFSGAYGMILTAAPTWLQALGTAGMIFLSVVVLVAIANVCLGIFTNKVPVKSDAVALFLRGAAILLAIMMISRLILSFEATRLMFGYTEWNGLDLSRDALTAGSLALFGLGYIVVQRFSGLAISPVGIKVHLVLALAGALVLVVGDILLGISQGSALRAVTEEGTFAAHWSGVLMADSALRSLSLVGNIMIFAGTIVGGVNLVSTLHSDAESYKEPALSSGAN